MIPTRDHARRSAALPCGACEAWTEVPLEPPPGATTCSACHGPLSLDLAARLGPDGALDGCPACAYHTLYIQKDVNARLGASLDYLRMPRIF